MSKPVRFGSAISLVALATVIGGCAAPQHHAGNASGIGGKADGEVGLATRALVALSSGDPATAIPLFERAVANSPGDASLRGLLGNAYFAAGRFGSAESAYKDSLSISADQPKLLLKLALVEIAQGRNADASALLDSRRDVLDAADYGLAIALAGRPSEAIAALDPIARAEGAEARVRQNLALAHALAGDWTNARAIAAQDVPADQLDARLHQWMQLASPSKPSDQVAALIGVTPAASDPGQPVQLALNKVDTRTAEAAPVAAPAAEPPVQVAEAVPPLPPPLMQAAPGDAPVAEAPAAPAFTPEVAPPPPPPVVHSARVVHVKLPKPTIRRAAGNSGAVVQIGAYSNAQRVATAWNAASKRYGALRAYTPMSARFDSGKGTFYRLSVKGFGSVSEANAVCASVRRGGGTCFVRKFAGDTPVQLASR
jgi:Flp pilus assembly protein TadD